MSAAFPKEMFTHQLADIAHAHISATAPDGSAAGGTPRCATALATADEAAVSVGTVVVVPAVFLFERQGDLNVFASVSDAAGWMEAIDVEDGGSAFLHDGTVLDVASASGAVVLTPTEARDLPLLERLLADYRRGLGVATSTVAPLDFANEWLRQDWERRWPRRPVWLARWFRGDSPPQVPNER